jgi:hypothetical protein
MNGHYKDQIIMTKLVLLKDVVIILLLKRLIREIPVYKTIQLIINLKKNLNKN